VEIRVGEGKDGLIRRSQHLPDIFSKPTQQKSKKIYGQANWAVKKLPRTYFVALSDTVDIFSRAALSKYSFGSGRLELLSAKSGIIEDAAASDRDFGWLPKGTLVIMPESAPTGFLS
jgi:hypothetical protein